MNGKVTEEIEYLSAIEEGDYIIAQANASLNEKLEIIDELVPCRYKNEFTFTTPRESALSWMCPLNKSYPLRLL